MMVLTGHGIGIEWYWNDPYTGTCGVVQPLCLEWTRCNAV